MKQERYQVTDAAKILGVNPWTLRRWVYAGKAPHIKTDTGRVFIPTWWIEQQIGRLPKSSDIRCAIYARESSSENKTALQTQLEGLGLADV